jgi:transposase InsO family protein
MELHGNAALSWSGRRRLAERVVVEGWTLTAAAEAAGVSVRCARKWVGRYRCEGEPGLRDRSSAPRRVANRTAEDRVRVIVALRRLRFTAAEIAETLGMALSTVSGILTRLGLGQLGRLRLEPPVRYERSRPGELVHIDVKKLGRIRGGAGKWVRGGSHGHESPRWRDERGSRRRTVGWDYVHVAVDDYSRLAYVEVLDDEKATTAIAFLQRARVFFARYGIQVEAILTDNGPAYRAAIHALACRSLGIKHLRTRAYRPQTNGKAERFIRTLINGWAYGAIYRSTSERAKALDGWLWHYNHRRRHSALSHQPPVTRTNLLGSYNYRGSLRPCSTTPIAPLRRAPFRQSLLAVEGQSPTFLKMWLLT